jgi:hypothetical protein
MSTCVSCGKFIQATKHDPIVAASSLGEGYYHYACAVETWRAQKSADESRRETSRANRSRIMKERWAARKEGES